MKTSKNLWWILLIATMLGSYTINAQQKYIDKKGKIVFEASEQLFEEVKAETATATAILDISTNQIASLALVKGFRFKNSLMEEHFNENYIESDTYPKAIFKGQLLDFDSSSLTASPSEVTVDGTLELHGRAKELQTTLQVRKTGNSILMEGAFIVTPEDFAISIPKIVRNKIAREVQVQLNFNLVQK